MTAERQRRLRKDSTDAERVLWRALRNRQFRGAKFRRQQRVGPYVVDLICHEHRLVLEIDGSQHASKDESARNARIAADGYGILRFWNHDVLTNVEGVLTEIERALRATPHPPGPGGPGPSLSHKGRGGVRPGHDEDPA